MASQIFYGNHELRPVPFVQIQKQYIKQGDQISRGVTFRLTLQGTIAVTDDGGIETLVDRQRDLRAAFNSDGKHFRLLCDDTVLLECYPRIIDLQFNPSNDNWVYTIPYTITIEYENDPADNAISGLGEDIGLHPAYIADFQESWNVQFAQDRSNHYSIGTSAGTDDNPYLLQVTHDVSAVGKAHWSKTATPSAGEQGVLDKQAWEQAKQYILDGEFLGFDDDVFEASSILNLEAGAWSTYDHYRTQAINKTAGSFSIQETWLVLKNNARIDRAAIEDFTVDVSTDQNAEYDTVNIQGSIQGLEERNYTGGVANDEFTINKTKYANASGYYFDIEQGNLIYPRVSAIAALHNITVNSTPLTETVAHNPNQGTVNYSYNYDSRPPNCIAGAKSEQITIQDNHPTDVFASLQVLGRCQGPILQSLNTVTEFTRNVSIDALVAPYTGCEITGLLSGGGYPGVAVASMLCDLENNLVGLYDKVFKSADTESWLPKTGRYSRNVTWTAVPCTTCPSTSFCP